MRTAKSRLCFAASVLLSAASAPVLAATFTVNSIDDAVDATPGGWLHMPHRWRRQCTLRAAVQEANADTVADDIVLPAGTYRLSLTGAGSWPVQRAMTSVTRFHRSGFLAATPWIPSSTDSVPIESSHVGQFDARGTAHDVERRDGSSTVSPNRWRRPG